VDPGPGWAPGACRGSGTFHAIGNRLIREYAGRLGLDPSFSVLIRADAADLMDVVRHPARPLADAPALPAQDTCLGIYSHPHQHAIAGCATASRNQRIPGVSTGEDALTGLYRAYVEEKLAQQALDYDDLLLYWQVMMRDDALAAEIRRALRPRAGRRVPGHQRTAGRDPAAAQARRLAGLTVVGDDAQAIYSFAAPPWRTSWNSRAVLATAHVVVLEENYRSTQPVLDARTR